MFVAAEDVGNNVVKMSDDPVNETMPLQFQSMLKLTGSPKLAGRSASGVKIDTGDICQTSPINTVVRRSSNPNQTHYFSAAKSEANKSVYVELMEQQVRLLEDER